MYQRICSCTQIILYKHKKSFKLAERKNSKCRSCSKKNKKFSDNHKKKLSENAKKRVGVLNPFFGRKHNDKAKESIKKKLIGIKHSKESNAKKIKRGKDNGMFGKSNYEIWARKYGEKKADILLSETKKKLSKAFSGEKNPMFGKPPPNGSGNGWSGWYKEWFFRSLKELSFVIKVIERFGFEWQSAESRFKISYKDYKGITRNYFPDFIINEKYLVEIKPKSLHESINVQNKKEAAIIFCKKNDLVYKLLDIDNLPFIEIEKLRKENIIKFTERYVQAYNNMRTLSIG